LADPRRRLDELTVGGSDIRGPVSRAYQRLTHEAQTALQAAAVEESSPGGRSAEPGRPTRERRVTDELLAAGLVELVGGALGGAYYRPSRLFRCCLSELRSPIRSLRSVTPHG
jgi:hypothetical protein